MNALPNYMLIEFFDWIKTNHNLRLFIELFSDYERRDSPIRSSMEDLDSYAEEYISQRGLNIAPYELIESIRIYLSKRNRNKKTTKRMKDKLLDEFIRNTTDEDENMLTHMPNACPEELYLGIEFLDWLLKHNLLADNLQKMPELIFKKLAEEFSLERKDEIDKELLSGLTQKFKDNPPRKFIDKCKRLTSINSFRDNTERYKPVTELFFRYSNPHIMNCLFLPLARDNMFEAFIENAWSDLNSLSKDFLDIYYSVRELSASGYDIKEKFYTLKKVPEDALPCLVLWVDNLDSAKYVKLRDLDYNDIFHLLQCIVQNIKEKDDFELVYLKAVEMANEKRSNNKPGYIVNQKFDIYNSEIKGSQLGTISSDLTIESDLQ